MNFLIAQFSPVSSYLQHILKLFKLQGRSKLCSVPAAQHLAVMFCTAPDSHTLHSCSHVLRSSSHVLRSSKQSCSAQQQTVMFCAAANSHVLRSSKQSCSVQQQLYPTQHQTVIPCTAAVMFCAAAVMFCAAANSHVLRGTKQSCSA